MKGWLAKFSSAGAVVAAAACPVCLPKLALVGAFFGLGALGAYEYQFFIASQILSMVAVAGHAFAYPRHRDAWRLGVALGGGTAVFAGLYLFGGEILVYIGFAGLVLASATPFWNRLRRRACKSS